jgi:hypothetical protein
MAVAFIFPAVSTQKQFASIISTHSCCTWRWLAQVAAFPPCCSHALLARRQSENILAGSNGDGGIGDGSIQLRQDGGSACLSAGGRLTAATAEWLSYQPLWNLIFVVLVFVLSYSDLSFVLIWPCYFYKMMCVVSLSALFSFLCHMSL